MDEDIIMLVLGALSFVLFICNISLFIMDKIDDMKLKKQMNKCELLQKLIADGFYNQSFDECADQLPDIIKKHKEKC